MAIMHPRLQPIEVTLPAYGVFVLESQHAPGFRMATSRHNFLEMFYVLAGEGTFLVAENRYAAASGDVVIVPPGAVHQIEDRPGQPLTLYGICVVAAVWHDEPVPTLPAGLLPLNELLRSRVRADLRQMLFEQTLAWPGHGAIITGLALQLLGLLVRGCSTPDRPATIAGQAAAHRAVVQQYVTELTHRFFEPTDLDQTAIALGMSRRRFTQLFRALTGTSWHAYLTRLRIDYACQLLQQTPRGIAAIAFECGYEDLSSFYRAFRRHSSLPPSEWRRQHGAPR
jgi:AraC family L-rhamnose operon regulatory protein RhaS